MTTNNNDKENHNPFEDKPVVFERNTKVRRAYGKMSTKVKKNLPWFKNPSSMDNNNKILLGEETNKDENIMDLNINKGFGISSSSSSSPSFQFQSPNNNNYKSTKKNIILEKSQQKSTPRSNRFIFSPYSSSSSCGNNKNNNNNNNDSKCFSKLANSNEIDSAWRNQVENYESGDIFKQENAVGNVTPKMKLISKKRGVCTSPAIESVDESSLISLSENNKNSGQKSYRCRSRSRLFSPNSLEKINSNNATNKLTTFDRSKSAITFTEYRKIESDDEKNNAQNISGIMDESYSEDDIINDQHPHQHQQRHHQNVMMMLPPKPRRKSSPDFVKSIFGTNRHHPSCWKDDDGKDLSYVSEKSLSPLPFSNNASSRQHQHQQRNNSFVLPSQDDQKYLLKTLLKHKKGRRKQAFLTNNSCTVALPYAWSAERKATFLQWSKSIGFTIRAVGGNDTPFLQTSIDKSIEVLKYLEDTLLVSKNKKEHQITNNSNNPMYQLEQHHNNIDDYNNSTLMSVEENLPLSYIEIPCHVAEDKNNTIDANLLRNLHDLKIDNNNTEGSFVAESNNRKKHNEFNNHCISPPFASCSRMTDDDQITPKDAISQRNIKIIRLSGEQIRKNELAMLMDDMISPIARNINPPKKLLLDSNEKQPSVAPCARAELSFEMIELNKATTISNNDISFSSASIGKVAVSRNAMDLTPCITKSDLNNCMQCSHETPMMKYVSTGKDWGATEGCDDTIIAMLFQRLEEACLDAIEQVNMSTETEANEIVLASCSVLGFEDCREQMQNDENENNRKKSVKFQDKSMESPLTKLERLKLSKVQKHHRVSLCISSLKENIATINNKQIFAVNGTQMDCVHNPNVMTEVFSFLTAKELSFTASHVCHSWADISSIVLASSMLQNMDFPADILATSSSSGDRDSFGSVAHDGNDISGFISPRLLNHSVTTNQLERAWNYLVEEYPSGQYLTEGAFKKVYRVLNRSADAEEAISVMDVNLIDSLGQKEVIAAEMAVSMLLSSLVRRNICPNFVVTRNFFISQHEPPSTLWGNETRPKPFGDNLKDNSVRKRTPREPGKNSRGRYLYTRMELCMGDVEAYITQQPGQVIDRSLARNLFFQMSYSLYVGQNYLGLKHYDVKLLNFLLKHANDRETSMTDGVTTVLRYGFGDHVFQLCTPTSEALVVKLADYGTAKIRSFSNGKPVTIGQFTTIENSPPEYFIDGDDAKQGHGHDCFGLGLCMFHLFTGHSPYEEILEDVVCPNSLQIKLKKIWESKTPIGFEVIKSVIRSDTYEDESGNIIDGKPDERPYHTFYRYLVLFGIPIDLKRKNGTNSARVWKAVSLWLEGKEADEFNRHKKLFNIAIGTDSRIAGARHELEVLGGMNLLLSLVNFDPLHRATPLDVINSSFMKPLKEVNDGINFTNNCNVHSYMKYATRNNFR